jgi:hypothetical protein
MGDELGICAVKVKQDIKTYSISQALRDPRVKTHVFMNHGIIVSYGKAEEQYPHMDSLLPNFQYVMVTDSIPITKTFSVFEECTNWELLFHAWGWNKLATLPTNLFSDLVKTDRCDVLEEYGELLAPNLTPIKHTVNLLARGGLTALPGTTTHCGPACKATRVILFFTSLPNEQEHDKYDADTHHCAVQVLAMAIHDVWNGIDKAGKEFMLARLFEIMEKPKYKAMKSSWEQLDQDNVVRYFMEKASSLKNSKTESKAMQLAKLIAEESTAIRKFD